MGIRLSYCLLDIINVLSSDVKLIFKIFFHIMESMTPHGGKREGAGRKKENKVTVTAYMDRDVRALWKRAAKVQGVKLVAVLEAALTEYAKRHKIPLSEPEKDKE